MFSEKQNRPRTSDLSQIQRKLEVGAKDDPREKEADTVAAQVMRMSESDTAPGEEESSEKKQDSQMARLLRRYPDTPRPQVIHRYADAPKARAVQRGSATIQGPASPILKKEEKEIMRDYDPGEEDKVMKKCEDCDEETVQKKEEEESVMKKEDEESVMKMEDDGGKGGTVPAAVEQGIQSSKGQGNPLPENVQQDIGVKMGADLSDVRVHTGSNAHEMSTVLNAKAFTHGQDVYFKNGNYDPSGSSGKALLTHELAHTQQQSLGTGNGAKRKVQRQNDIDPTKDFPWKGNVTGKHANVALRRNPYKKSNIAPLADLPAGHEVLVLSVTSTGWLYVKTTYKGKELTGYIDRHLIVYGQKVHEVELLNKSGKKEATLINDDDMVNAGLIATGNLLNHVGAPETQYLREIYKNGLAQIEAEKARMTAAKYSESAIAKKMAEMRTQLAIDVRETGSKLLKKGAEMVDMVRGNKGRPTYESLKASGKTDAQIIESATRSNKYINALPKWMKWTGRGFWIASAGYSIYVIANAPDDITRAKVLNDEISGFLGGMIGGAATVGLCVASGLATGGLGLIVCGIAGSIGGYALGKKMNLAQILDLAPTTHAELAGKLYRVHGTTGDIDLFLLYFSGKEITDNILVMHTGVVSSQKVDGRGHYRNHLMLPANNAAVKFFGKRDTKYISQRNLRLATAKDLMNSD